jgi:hypothetical protein
MVTKANTRVKSPGRKKGAKNLYRVITLLEKSKFPTEPEEDDFLNDNHLLGMQCLELAVTLFLRSARIIKEDENLVFLGKFSVFTDADNTQLDKNNKISIKEAGK